MNTNLQNATKLDRASAAFGLAAAITVLFNMVLTWAKEAYEPLNVFMKSLTGHHWITHGITDVVLFVLLGMIFMNTGVVEKMSPNSLVLTLIGAVVVAGLGLAGWFLVY